ncbi:MAG: hypothetical protein M3367_10375 [Acidobacteriota bacterium]|nr:hypothetical protein [Acidobacteriota bacterium]
MSLLGVQNFLARLYTDENLRREFLSAPEQTGRENNLTEKEIAELSAILPAELNLFADSLRWKRLREVEKLLPLTKRALAEDFEIYFREFASGFLPATVKKHLEDAIQFAEFLQGKEKNWKKNLAKYEQAKLEFNNCGKNFIFKVFDYDIKEIFRKGVGAQGEFKRKKTFAVWLRIGKLARQFIW